jgi:hypothetical protein
VSLNGVLWFLSSTAEVAVIGLLLYRRMWRTFPVFLVYSVWTLVSNATLYFLFLRVGEFARVYATAYLAVIVVDSILQFCVLLELGWSILRPLRPAPPRSALIPVAVLILVVGAAIWPFANPPWHQGLSPQVLVVRHLQHSFSILRVLVLVALAVFSQSLALGWRNRELQIATGLGVNSLVSLVVTMLFAYPSMRAEYFLLSEMVVASYLCSLLYWIVSFAQQEQERREFSPQMQSLLLAVAGSARNTRLALEEVRSGKDSSR